METTSLFVWVFLLEDVIGRQLMKIKCSFKKEVIYKLVYSQTTSLFSLHLPLGQNTHTYPTCFCLKWHMPMLAFQLWLFYSLEGLESTTALLHFHYVAVLSFKGNQLHIVLFLCFLLRFRKKKKRRRILLN